MASECRAKDPTTCRTHGTGGVLQQLKLKAHQALNSGDTKQFFRLKEEIENIPDDERDARRASFFNRFASRSTKKEDSSVQSSDLKSNVSPEIVRKALVNYFPTSLYDDSLTEKVTPVLSDASKSVKSESSNASVAAEEVYSMIWDDFSEKNGNKNTGKGGVASAKATVELFHRMNRTTELGWIESEAPGHLSLLRLEDTRATSWIRDGKG